MRVAVYGTLRKGQINWVNCLEGLSEFVGEYRVEGFDLHSPGGFPFALPGKGAITVEVFEIGQRVLDRLDRLEGYPRFYNRKTIEVGGADAWIYFTEDKGKRSYEKITSGDWMIYFAEKGYSYENA